MNKQFFCLATLGLVLSGCGALSNTENDALTVAERHPITVDQQTVSISVPVDPTLSGLSRQTVGQLDNFLTVYRTKGHGPVTVTAPSGTSRDLDGQETAANVRQALNALGLDYAQMQGASYRTGERPAAVIVSFTRYVASGPVCGIFTGDTMRRYKNLPSNNYGCADQQNLAAMVSDPRDLTSMQQAAPANAAGVVTAIELGALPTGGDLGESEE